MAQDFYLPVNRLSIQRMERAGLMVQDPVHFGIKPIANRNVEVKGITGLEVDSTKYYYWITEKIFSDHLIELSTEDFKLNADFIFDFNFGGELDSPSENFSTFINQRGFAVSAQIGKRVFLYTDLREVQTRTPFYINEFADSLAVLPGTPQVKSFKETGYDYNWANGYVGVRAADWLDLSLGHYEQFIGFGRRSLILSDNSFNYPFASYDIHPVKSKFQFRYTIGILQNLERLPAGQAPESLFKRKHFNMNYLSFKPLSNLEIGLAEVIIWRSFDDSSGTQPFNYLALIPIPGLNTAIEGFGSNDHNSLLGLNLAWHPLRRLSLYGQLMLDDPDENRYGYQLGAKYRQILNRIDLGFEFNHVQPFAYSAPDPLQSFSNSNQSLAHTLGAGFDEYIVDLTYLHKRVLLAAELVFADFTGEGRDILKGEGESNISNTQSVNYQNLRMAYVFNPKTNMQIYCGLTNRVEDVLNSSNTNQFWYFGIKTYLANTYVDF